MANIKELIQSIESGDSSFDEKLAVINEMQDTLIAMKEHEEEVIDDNVELIIEALRTIEAKVEAKLRIIPEKGEQGIQGPKGEKGEQGLDGYQGKDGKSGVDGKDGLDGKDGVSVQDAKIDFDGSLVITLSDGREINVGEVVPVDVAQTIHKIQSGSGGDSQTTLNAIAALQATIATYGTMATQNANNVAITGGTINNTTVGATTPATGRFSDLTDTGLTSGRVVYASTGGNLVDSANLSFNGTTLVANDFTDSSLTATRVVYAGTGGNLVNASNFTYDGTNLVAGAIQNTPIGATTPATGVFTTLTGNSTSQFGRGSANYLQAVGGATTVSPVLSAAGGDTNIPLVLQPKGTGALQAQQTDSTATGGNARGANAVDWSTTRDSAAKVASGSGAVLGGGYASSSQGLYSVVVGGALNAASGESSFIGSGSVNAASQQKTVTVGGNSNSSTRDYAAIVGGQSNNATGYFNFIGGGASNTGTANAAVTTQSGTMNATTAVTLSGSNANIKVGQLITGTSIAQFTYVAAISGTSLTLSQAASGSSTSTLSFFTPHGVVVGGGNNQATGSYSFIGGGGDAGTASNRNVASGPWSAVVGGIKNTASGEAAFVGGGGSYSGGLVFPNTASGNASVVVGGINHISSQLGSTIGGGYGNIANSTYGTVVGGSLGSTKGINGNTVFAAQQAVFSQTGSVQAALLCLATSTSDATATRLVSDNTVTPSTANQVILPNNSAYFFRGEVVSGVTGGGNTKGWTIEGVIKRGANAASTALVGTPQVVSSFADVGAATWTIAVTADTTNGGLAVTFTGQAATTIRTVAQIRTTEMTY